jgi:hypothetical protein
MKNKKKINELRDKIKIKAKECARLIDETQEHIPDSECTSLENEIDNEIEVEIESNQ